MPYRTETEIIQQLSPEAKEKTQHSRNIEDNLAVRDIQQKVLPHPFAPFFLTLGMTGRTESSAFVVEAQEPFFPTVGTPDVGKSTYRIAIVEILLNNTLDHGTEKAILSLKPALVFSEKLLEVMKKHPIKNSELRMTLTVDPCHGSGDDSKNGPSRSLQKN